MSFAVTPPPSVLVDAGPGGVLRLRSALPLPPVAPSLPHLFDEIASAHPDRVFLRQRDAEGDWRSITYAAARRAADGLAQWLIDRGVGFGDTVSFLSGPSIEHGIAAIGVQRSGAAIAPVSVGYSLLSSDHVQLRDCVAVVGARVVIVDDAARYADAMRSVADLGVLFVAVQGDAAGLDVVRWADVIATPPTAQLGTRMAAISPDTIARIMYTSGSTGSPKATPQPQANLTVTVAQVEAVNLHDFGGEAPQLLEAMPFSHIMAGNFNFNNVIRAGGTIWIDEGKPTAELFHKTIENLRDVSPHFFITVPLGYAMLCDAMERDDALRDNFFRNVAWLGFGGAVLPQSVERRLLALSRVARGAEVPIYSFYGATEYLFGALKYWLGGSTDVIGLPLPGVELKLVPLDDRYEMLIRAPTLMPRTGYIGAPEASLSLFDEEGFFRTGDAVRFADPDRPEAGLVFAGRLSEDFKLLSGTYVTTAALRENLLHHCEDLIGEVVLCGVNEPFVGALLWVRDGVQQEEIRQRIATFNAGQSGSAKRIGAALVEHLPLSFDLGELTDKRNVAARKVRELRARDVARLFARELDPDVMRFGPRLSRGDIPSTSPRSGTLANPLESDPLPAGSQ